MIIVGLVAVGAAVAACVQAAGGLGFALVLTPVLFAGMRPAAAIMTATALGLLLNLLVLFAERRRPAVAWRELAPILVAAVPGSACGLLVLESVPKAALQIVIGVVVVTALIVRPVRRPRRNQALGRGTDGSGRRSEAIERPGRGTWSRLAIGFTTGTLSTSTGVSGPPLALWLAPRSRTHHHLRDSLSVLFLGMGVIAALTLAPLLPRTHPAPVTILLAAAGVVAGHAVGSRIFARLTGRRFHYAMSAIILASGLTSLVLGLSAIR